MMSHTTVALAVLLASASTACAQLVEPEPPVKIPPAVRPGNEPPPDYVIAISSKAAADPAWKAVADALAERHRRDAAIIRVSFESGRPETLIDPLQKAEARYLAVVVTPEEAGRAFVGGLHRAMRKLDEDPRCDVRWGIITARTAAGATKLAADAPSVIARSAFGTADFPMNLFERAWWWSEESAWHFTMHERKPGEPEVERPMDEASVGRMVAEAINGRPIDVVMTGGHATERGLELGFRKPAGRLGPKDGVMAVQCLDGTTIKVDSPSPKAWIAAGNCLIGNVDGPDSTAATLVEDFGVRAHVGYVVVTWFGRAGWGTLKRFTEHPGIHSLNEAWTYTNDDIVDELAKRWPALEEINVGDVTFAGWLENDPDRFAAEVTRELGDRVPASDLKDLIGLLWDRDATSYIGDPMWDIRLARPAPAPPAVVK